jgi:hypothetical protein
MAVAINDGVSLFVRSMDDQIQASVTLRLPDGARDAKIDGKYLYVLHHEGLRIMTLDSPGEPVRIGELPLDGRPLLLEMLSPGRLLVATRDDGVLVVDVNDPRQPVVVSSLVTPWYLQTGTIPQDLLVDGQRVYIAQGSGGVLVADFSNPSRPELLQVIKTPGIARKMAIYDNLLLVADSLKGVFIIDVEDRRRALPVGSMPTPLRAVDIAVADDGLIVSSRLGGAMKLPMPQRLRNVRLISKEELRVGVDKAARFTHVYLYDGKRSERLAMGMFGAGGQNL